ncbi:TetR/AcrR family transcriptional regulator [Melaminivora sp.]
MQLAAQRNPSDITTTVIARHMGVTQGALFKHFPSKEAIFESVMEWVAERLLGRIDQAMQPALEVGGPLAALEAVFRAHVDFVIEHPGVPRMLFGELQRTEMTAPKRLAQALLRQYSQRLLQLLEQGRQQGLVRAQVQLPAAAALFIGSVQGLVMQSLLQGDVQYMRAQAEGVLALYRQAIALPEEQRS